MIPSRKSFFYFRLFSDLLLLNAAFITAAVVSQSFDTLLERSHMFALMAVLNFFWYFLSNVLNFYDDFNSRYYSFQFPNILKNVIAQGVVSVFFIFLVKEDLFTRNFILIYSVLLLVFISIRIQALRKVLIGIMGRAKHLKNIIVIGTGELGRNFREFILSKKEFGFNFSGYVDVGGSPTGGDVLGDIKDLENVIINNKINEVVVAIPLKESARLNEIIKICNRHAVRTHIIPDYFQFISKKYKLNIIGDMPVITIRDEPLAEVHWRILKRIFDLILSAAAILFILSWLMPVIYILNLLYSPGKLIFKQDRIGTGSRLFKCYKFRTMQISGGQNFQPAVKGDPRITKIGGLLRKTNIDELPQFFNVLKGEMSVVGPRPHPIPFHEVYKQIVDEIRLRSLVKPGITGWAQVHGFRGDVTDPVENRERTIRRIEYDLWYIENWSFWLDLQIILRTIWQMLTGNTKGV